MHYLLRKNFKTVLLTEDKTIHASIAFKTKETHWVNTTEAVIILVSVHSVFNEQLNGHLKMNALISVIKNNVQGAVTILLADRAHIRALALEDPIEDIEEKCLVDAKALHERFKVYFTGCRVCYWHSYVVQDRRFPALMETIKCLFDQDLQFRMHLYLDAEAVYLTKSIQLSIGKEQFIQKTIEDILEQCACILVLAAKGYRFQFYPGQSYRATDYVNKQLLVADGLCWINVYIGIEKKTILDRQFEYDLETKISPLSLH